MVDIPAHDRVAHYITSLLFLVFFVFAFCYLLFHPVPLAIDSHTVGAFTAVLFKFLLVPFRHPFKNERYFGKGRYMYYLSFFEWAISSI